MSHDGTAMHLRATIASPQGNVGTIASPHGDGSMFGGRTRFRGPETPPPGPTAPRVRVPVRGSSVITGLGRSCRAELIGFASPIGRLSAILRITDEATGNTATSVVPVGLPGPIEGATRTPELMMPQSEVRARDLWAETEPVRLLPSLRAGTLLEELLTADFDDTSAHRLSLVLTTALYAGALASACVTASRRDIGFDVGPKSNAQPTQGGVGMTEATHAYDWRGREIVDSDGKKIGTIEELYYDNETTRPEWAAIRTGMPGTKLSVVPISQLQPHGEELRVPFGKAQIKDAPSIDPDRDLSQAEEERLYSHYGLSYGGRRSDSGLREGLREGARPARPRPQRRASTGAGVRVGKEES